MVTSNWQLIGSIVVEPERWVYSNPVPNNGKLLRLRSFTQPQTGRATFCLRVPDGQYGFRRFYPTNEPVLIEIPPLQSWQWKRVGLRGTARLGGVWIVNIEMSGMN